ncbi:hypothetical protein AGR6A_Lc10003 [Agrobacterium sp. NCPPB 925]|nr:hypothetical protein AGR6A_Lc10003 [Agrobacterium sp. NCPPB 925]
MRVATDFRGRLPCADAKGSMRISGTLRLILVIKGEVKGDCNGYQRPEFIRRAINAAFTGLLYFMDFLLRLCYRRDARRECV